MARKRPVVLIVFAVVQIVFAVLGFCCGPAFVLSGSLDALIHVQDRFPKQPQQLDQVELWTGMAERLPWFHTYTVGTSAFSVVLSAMMIVGAVGLLRLRPWGWYVTLAWALASCVVGTLGILVALFVINPVMGEVTTELFAKIPPPPPGRPDLRPFLEWSLWAGNLFGMVVGISGALYPFIMLGILCLPSMRKPFRSDPLPPAPVEPEPLPSAP